MLWPPDQANLLYLAGDKSRVLDIDNPDPDQVTPLQFLSRNSLSSQFPLFHQAWRHEVELMPGDLLYIPALWFHNMKARDFGVAVNIFWKELEGRLYDQKVTLCLGEYFFSLLKRIWEIGVGEITNAVISPPVHFTPSQPGSVR